VATTLLDMFVPVTAETAGTPRTEAITNAPFDTQIRNAGMSVLDAMFSAAKDSIISIAAGTEAGQQVIATANQQAQANAIAQYGPLILIGLLVVAVMVGMGLKR
jgi:hypothetical protein